MSRDDSLPLGGSLKLRWVVVIDRQKVSLRAQREGERLFVSLARRDTFRFRG